MKHLFAILLLGCGIVLSGATEVFNAGVTGLTIQGISGSRFKKIAAQKPDLAVIMLGREETLNPKKFCTTEELKQNFEKVLARFARIKCPVILINIPPRKGNPQIAKRIEDANAMLFKLAAEKQITLIDLAKLINDPKANAPREYLKRKIFTASDCTLLAKITAAVIRKKFPSARRIICIGGEETYGYRLNGAGTNSGESYPAQLKLILNGTSKASLMPSIKPLPGSFISRAKWIWYPEGFRNKRNTIRIFRKNFSLKQVPRQAVLLYSGDDVAEVFINGSKVSSGNWKNVSRTDVRKFLKPGKNIIAISVNNYAVDGGLICRLDMIDNDGKTAEIVSDSSWKSFTPADGKEWFAPDFDELNAEEPWVIGDAGALPWARVAGFDYRIYLAEDEKKAQTAAAQRFSRRKKAMIEKLNAEPDAPSFRVQYSSGCAEISDGKNVFAPMIYHTSSWNPCDYRNAVYADSMTRNGCRLFKIHVAVNTGIWEENGINMAPIEEKIYRLLDIAPDALILIGIGLNAPEWWIEKNPSETVGYARKGIAPEYKIKDQQRALRASYVSEKWRKDTADVLAGIISRLEKMPFGKRIFAYAIHGGVYNTEWHYFGMRNEMPDNGSAMTAYFRKFLKQRYGKAEKLQKAWKNPDVDFKNAAVPGAKARSLRKTGAVRTADDGQDVLDYQECHQQAISETILFFNRAAKEACKNRALVGNYSGYFFEMNFPTEGWLVNNRRVLESKYTDFQISPYGYGEFRMIGSGGFSRSILSSYPLRNKLLIYEDDSRTHLNLVAGGHYANNADESAALLMRNFGQIITSGCGVWHLDFSRGWFEDYTIKNAFKTMHRIMNMKRKSGSTAEAALVCDFDSVYYHTYSDNRKALLNRSLTDGLILQLGQCAIPFDPILPEDIGKPGLPDYKVYIFCNMLKYTPERAKMVKELQAKGKNLIWFYAPGSINNGRISGASSAELTGFNLKLLRQGGEVVTSVRNFPGVTDGHKIRADRARHKVDDAPVWVLDDKKAEICGTARIDGREYPTLGIKKHGKGFSLLHTAPCFDRKSFLAALKLAGCHQYLAEPAKGDVIFANKEFLFFHTENGGMREFVLNTPAAVTELFPGKAKISAKPVTRFTWNAKPGSTVVFHLTKK